MPNTKDKENLVNADYAAKLLVQNLTSVIESKTPFLSDIALEIQKEAVEIEKRVQRLLLSVNRS